MRYALGLALSLAIATVHHTGLQAGDSPVRAERIDRTTAAPAAVSERRASQDARTSDDAVLAWNEIAVATIGAQPPFASTRFMATVHLAVFEAVNAITRKYDPYLGTVIAPPDASTEAAAIAAAHGVLKAFFPLAADALDQQREASLALIPDGQARTDGVAAGEAAASAMIAERTGDGSAPPQFHLPSNSNPYEWQKTAVCPAAGGAFLHWRNVKPFGVLYASQFRAPAPHPLTSEEYTRDFKEVLAVGDINSPSRSSHQAHVALIYAAQPPHRGWNSVASQIIDARDDEITDTARVLALMNMSLADAHITVFESKYFYRTWRPETAIPGAGSDGNPATAPAAFTPFVTTPCFPGYPSAHGVGAGAASRILWKAYGRHHTVTNSHPAVPGVILTYDDLLDIVKAVSDARVYGGIHFRFDQDAAEDQGKSIAQWNLDNYLLPR